MDAPTADPPIGLDEAGDGDPPLASPFLALDSFAGPLAQLLARARAQKIDLARISLPALLDQLAAALHAAGRGTPLGQQGDWLVMAAWLVLLRSRLLLPAGSPAQQDAVREAGQLRARLRDLQAAQALAAWLERRPQLGHDFFGPGQPERAGTEPEPAPQVDVIEFLWAAMALFDDGSPDVDTASVYRPGWTCTACWTLASACSGCLRRCRTAHRSASCCRPAGWRAVIRRGSGCAGAPPGRAPSWPAWNWNARGWWCWHRTRHSRRSRCGRPTAHPSRAEPATRWSGHSRARDEINESCCRDAVMAGLVW